MALPRGILHGAFPVSAGDIGHPDVDCRQAGADPHQRAAPGSGDRPSAAFRIALRMWLPRTAVAVHHFHLISLANPAMRQSTLRHLSVAYAYRTWTLGMREPPGVPLWKVQTKRNRATVTAEKRFIGA